MADASYQVTNFQGGELSQAYQGRYDLPSYKTSLAACLNSFPTEAGNWVRRSGSQFCQTTRGGNPGRVITFDVEEQNPLTLEFTDLFLRVFSGPALVTTNDAQTITAISAANPAQITTANPHGWSSGNSVLLPGINMPLLQNRAFTITKTSSTQFTIKDAITGAGIDGSTLGSFTAGTARRILEIATSYGAQSWQTIRSVQAELETVLLNGSQPQVLTLTAAPTAISQPTFSLAPSNFLDGPYLDPFNGSIATYDVLSGNVTLTFSFQPYSATTSYNVGDFVTFSGQGYQSLTAANEGNQPNTHPSNWNAVNGGAPVGPNGFTSADIGRHIRLFSEPATWASGNTYSSGNVVKFNGAYYQATAGSTGVTPGTDATKWAVVSGAQYAVWTWGRILSVSGSGLINPSVAIGNIGALSAAFDGNLSKPHTTCATSSVTVSARSAFNPNDAHSVGDIVEYNGAFYQVITNNIEQYVGKSYSGDFNWVYYQGRYYQIAFQNSNVYPPPPNGFWQDVGVGNPTNTTVWQNIGAASNASLDLNAGQDYHAAPKQIAYATVFPSTDFGFGSNLPSSFVLNLRAKQTLPGGPTDGTIIGTSGAISNTTSPVTVTSTDTATHWAYVWVELSATATQPLPDNGSHTFTMSAYVGQVEIFGANVANGSVVTIQLAGPALLYQAGTVVNTWRAGLYSNGAGWPTCGTYHDGRLWFAGVVGNRFDASNSDDLFNFAPTGPDGTVSDSNAISYTLNAPDVNPILWMTPEGPGIMAGTQKREWLIQPASTSAGLTPTNIVANPVTHIGCAFIEPRHAEHTLLFVQKRQRNVAEGFPDVFSGKFTAPNLTEKAMHLTVGLIQEIAYQQKLTPTIWARCGDGSLIGATYKRDTLMTSQGPTFIGWHRHALGSARLVESITVGPSQAGTLDALTMVTNDPKTGIRHVELLADYFEETSALQNAWLVDDAVVPASSSISNSSPSPYGGMTLNGLWHLNGKTVSVSAGGLDCGDYTVSSGSVTVPFGDSVSAGTANGLFTAAFVATFTSIPIVVGFTYNSDGQLVRPNLPAETGARNGPAFAKKRRNHWFGIQCANTSGAALSIGTDFTKLDPINFQTDAQVNFAANQMFSGVWSDAIDDTESFDGMICWRVSRPLPATITSIGGFVETVDK